MAEKQRLIESLLADESFQSWLANRASDEESKKWAKWLDLNPLNREIYQEALEIWKLGRFKLAAASPDVERELKRLRTRLKLPQASDHSSQSSPVFIHPMSRKFNLSYLWIGIGAAAAVVAILVTIWLSQPSIFNFSSGQDYRVVSTHFGERMRLNLPDNSFIVLNANSTLHYPNMWSAETKRTFKLSGEAYFRVSSQPPGAAHEFVVITNDGLIRVLGTRFDVYARGNGTRVTLEEGGLEVIAKNSVDERINPEVKVNLSPGYSLRFRKGDRLLKPERTETNSYIAWWKKQFEFDQTPLSEIVKRLEETYGIEVEVTDKKLLDRTLSGSIENRNLEILLEALSKVLQVPFHRDGKLIVFGKTPA